MKKVLIISLAILSLTFFTACGGGGGGGGGDEENGVGTVSTPEDTINGYADALEKGDIDKAVSYVLEDRRQTFKEILSNLGNTYNYNYAQLLKEGKISSTTCETENPKNGERCIYSLKQTLDGEEVEADQELYFYNGIWYIGN